MAVNIKGSFFYEAVRNGQAGMDLAGGEIKLDSKENTTKYHIYSIFIPR